MKNKIIVLLMISLLFITGFSTNQEELVLATEAGFAPYEYYQDGNIVGVDIDIANEIAKELNMKLIIKDVAFDSIINEVKTGKSDLGIAGISYTPERAKEVDFSIDYMESRQVLIVKNNSSIRNPRELTTESIAVQLGSVADTYLTEEYSRVNIVREKKFLAAIQDLKDDKVSGVVMDEVPAKALISADLKILDEPLVTDHYGIIVSKGNEELLTRINKVITRLKETGKIDEILLKHLGVAEEKKDSQEKLNIIDKFYYSIIYDGRYKYILEGLKNTLLIALGAVLLGVLLGGVAAISQNIYDNTGKLKLLDKIAKLYVTVIRGTPSTLQLMIIYYIIFKSLSVNIVLVGILAFGINSGAYVAEIIRAGINSVDKGQIEAGYALGLHYSQVTSKIVLPMAIKNILPALGNEFITLVKETSIGAYIGIIELTKASDIIASRTYDYFFPLMLIALIYLAITLCLTKVIRAMEVKLNHARS
ncbi:MAG: ABC transporter permease subunit [Bacilli bacterium]|nr:ABC transporter permease subunit [Bacilli bacterium]